MPGETIGRYRIVERIGRGGMGVLYRGLDPVLEREVAIKVMSTDFESGDHSDDARSRFFREARAAARLQHRNIVTVFEFAEEDGVPYIVMEFLRGQSLSSRLLSGLPLSLEQKLDIVSELCAGLQFAHDNGVLHRDVKPDNVWLLEDGSVKLLDFGIAKLLASSTTHRGDVLGSACYMAPEQVFGDALDGRADIFAAAVVLYELVAGRRPFEGDSPTATLHLIVREPPPPLESLVTGLPAALITSIKRGLQKLPADRYQTAGDFAADLQLIRMALSSGESGSVDVVWDDTVCASDPQPVAQGDRGSRLMDTEVSEVGNQPDPPPDADARGGVLSRLRAALRLFLSNLRDRAWATGALIVVSGMIGPDARLLDRSREATAEVTRFTERLRFDVSVNTSSVMIMPVTDSTLQN